jgi:hypothetical protein
MGYLVVPVNRDLVEAQEAMTEVIRAVWPSWKADPADPMTVLRDAAAVLYTDAAIIASRVGEEIFRYYGINLAGIPAIDEVAATGTVEFTAQDTSGPYVVPEGLPIVGRNSSGELVEFVTATEATVPNGATTVEVAVVATEEGEGGNDISGTADFSSYVDYLTAVEFTEPTSGGQEAETLEAYLDRLSEELALMSPRPILLNDYAVLARKFGAYRATVVDGLKVSDNTLGNAGYVAIAMLDDTGSPMVGADADAIVAQIDAMREVGFVVQRLDATENTIGVQWTGVAHAGADPDDVETAGNLALADYLSGLYWGLRGHTGQEREWVNDSAVRWSSVMAALSRVEPLAYVTNLQLKVGAGAFAAHGADVAMTGRAPIPTPGTITGTVS